MTFARRNGWAAVLVVLSIVPLIAADPPEAGRDASLEWMRASAEQYRLTFESEDGAGDPAELRSEPILRWTNPTRQTGDGTLFLWTKEGRPVAALCIFPMKGAYDHEWTSLPERNPRATFPGGKDWTPAEPGVTFRPVPDAPAPAATAGGRLVQMRSIARRLEAFVRKAPQTDRLRVLTQPVYRYPEGAAGADDGAIFAFVQATDPEVLLLLESRPAGGGPAWQFALARMSSLYLECREGDRVIWTRETDWSGDPTHPYIKYAGRLPAREE